MSADAFLSSKFSLSGRTALVTGGGRGIGHAIAHGLARAGARVAINGRDRARLDGVVAEWRAEGLSAETAPFDVTDPVAVREGVAELEARTGGIHILINNAGMQHRSSLELFEDDDWRRIVDTNLSSAFYVSKSVAKGMIERRLGQIINICSVQSELGRPSIAPYAATKGALKMLTKGMAIDWGPYGIRVNAIGPGYFRTDLNAALVADEQFSTWLTGRTPLKRWGHVEELVGAAIFLASDASSFMTGQLIFVDGGVTSSL
jgi:gluconate 5-dehydrogenase